MSEQDIKNAILDWLALQRNCVAWVTDSVGIFDPVKKVYRQRKSKHHRKGVSDIVACWRGRILCIEVKSKKGYPTPEQKIFIEQVRQAGGLAVVARSINDVEEYLRVESLMETMRAV